MNKDEKINLEEFKTNYDNLKSTFDEFLKSVDNELNKLISDSEINLAFPLQTRTKTWDSISDKIERVPISLKKVSDMQDLCGMRIVLLFSRDINKVIELIEDNLDVIKKYNTGDRLKNNQFGYNSTHIIAKLPDEWLKVPTMKNFQDIKIEIQIRTISQHLWAEASNTLQYKKEESVPQEVLRSVSRASALLEVVDLEFERVLEERENYRSDIKEEKQNEDAILNVDLLEQILDNHLPLKNKDSNEQYSELIKNLQLINVKTKSSLISLIKDNLENVLIDEEKHLNNILESINKQLFVAPEIKDRALNGVFYAHTGLIRGMISNEAGIPWNKIDEKLDQE